MAKVLQELIEVEIIRVDSTPRINEIAAYYRRYIDTIKLLEGKPLKAQLTAVYRHFMIAEELINKQEKNLNVLKTVSFDDLRSQGLSPKVIPLLDTNIQLVKGLLKFIKETTDNLPMPNIQDPKEHLKGRKKSAVTFIPSMLPEGVTMSHVVSGEDNKGVGLYNIIGPDSSESPTAEESATFTNSPYVVFDLETAENSEGIHIPYIIGYVIKHHDPNNNNAVVYTRRITYLGMNATPDQISLALLEMMKDIENVLNLGPRLKRDGTPARSRKHKVIMLAHNGANFDIKVLLNNFVNLASKQVIAITHVIYTPNMELYQLSFTHGNVDYYVRDSFKILPASVESLSKSFLGNTITKLPVNHEKLNAILKSKSVADLSQ